MMKSEIDEIKKNLSKLSKNDVYFISEIANCPTHDKLLVCILEELNKDNKKTLFYNSHLSFCGKKVRDFIHQIGNSDKPYVYEEILFDGPAPTTLEYIENKIKTKYKSVDYIVLDINWFITKEISGSAPFSKKALQTFDDREKTIHKICLMAKKYSIPIIVVEQYITIEKIMSKNGWYNCEKEIDNNINNLISIARKYANCVTYIKR